MKPATSKPKPTLTPRLRFPEFRDATGWTSVPLKQVADINPSADELPGSFIYIDLESVEAGELKARNRIPRQGAPSRAQRLLRNGDVIFQTVRPYQKNNLFCVCEESEDYVASTGYAQLRARQSERFLYHAVHNDDFVSAVMAKCTGSNYPAINSADLSEIDLAVPPSPAEQHKIASCLSSLDDVIAAERQKLEALNAHKKGLMQQLFPREGETRPRLRFPEFQTAPEWENKPLSRLAKRVTTKNALLNQSRVLTNSAESGIVDQGSYFDREIVTKSNLGVYAIVEKGDFVYNPRVSTLAPVGPISRNDLGTGVMSPLYTVFRFTFSATDFFAHLFKTSVWHPYLKDASNSGARHDRMSISTTDFMNLPIPVPAPTEQHRIASCLSTLDELIAVQTYKIETLKSHKKGLMQQLFPSPEANTP